MNKHTASEHAAAEMLREAAKAYACAYTENAVDMPAARLALLMVAAEQEAREQGFTTKVGFLHQEKQDD